MKERERAFKSSVSVSAARVAGRMRRSGYPPNMPIRCEEVGDPLPSFAVTFNSRLASLRAGYLPRVGLGHPDRAADVDHYRAGSTSGRKSSAKRITPSHIALSGKAHREERGRTSIDHSSIPTNVVRDIPFVPAHVNRCPDDHTVVVLQPGKSDRVRSQMSISVPEGRITSPKENGDPAGLPFSGAGHQHNPCHDRPTSHPCPSLA
jgi:hypothetical protein